MSKSKYGEPLRYVRDIDGPKLFGHASDGECLFAEICDGDVDTDVLMARAVACVNACEGMETPEKEIEALRSVAYAASVFVAKIRTSGKTASIEEADSLHQSLLELGDAIAALMGEMT